MKAFRHEVPEDNLDPDTGETAIKTVVILARTKTDKPAWVTLWIDNKKPKIFYFQPVLYFGRIGAEMKHQFDYKLPSEPAKFIIRDLFKEKSQFMFLYEKFYNM